MLAVGGWVWSRNFSDVMQTQGQRQTFARSCIDIMLDYGMDGIDIGTLFSVSIGGISFTCACLSCFVQTTSSLWQRGTLA